MKTDFIDRTLIYLKRQYDKDEVVSALYKKLSENEIEIGKLNSEIEHLKSELQIDKESKEINLLAKIEAKKEEYYMIKIKECKKYRKEIRQLRHQRNDLISKCYILENNLK